MQVGSWSHVWAEAAALGMRGQSWVMAATSQKWGGLNVTATVRHCYWNNVFTQLLQLSNSSSQKKKKKKIPNPLSYFCFVFTKIRATWKNHISPPCFQAQTLKQNVFKAKWKRQSQGTYPETRVSAKTISFPGPDAQWLQELLQNSSQTVSYRQSLIYH